MIQLENKNPLNFISENPNIENSELKNILIRIKDPIRKPNKIHKYNQTLNNLHN
jgi:hypothetical protein